MARPRTVTDDAILGAAQRLVALRGPDRTTLAAVAAEVGLSAPTLVQRFGSKDGLLRAMTLHAARTVPASLGAVPPGTTDPVEALVAALGTRGLARLSADPARMVNQVAMLQRDLADPELHAGSAAHARAVRGAVAALLERFAGGALRPDAPWADLARTVQVVLNGALIAWAIEPEGDLDDLLRTQFAAVLAPHLTGGDRPGG
jgi:AcrR family transcriptional regulator